MAGEEAEILRCVRAIQKAAHQRGQAMINTMRQMHADHINDLQETRDTIDNMTKELESVCAVVRENINSATDHEYVTKHRALYENIEKQIKQKVPKTVDKSLPRIKFISNKGAESMVNLGHLQTTKVIDVNAELCSQLTIGCADRTDDKIEDITALSDGSLAVVFKDRVRIYKTTGKFENVKEEEYNMDLSLEPPLGYSDKPCWVGSSDTKEWVTLGVTILDGRFAVMDATPFVKIYSSTGKFQSMFTTLEMPSSSTEYRLSHDAETPENSVNYTCITQDVDGKSVFLGDYARKVITTHDSTGKCLRSFFLQDAPYKLNVFGQRIAVTTIADRVDILDKVTGDTILRVDIPLATGACVDIKSGCMFVTTSDDDSFKKENGTLEAYCSMTGNHMRCLVPALHEPCGAMALMSDDKLAVVDKEGVNFYDLKYDYQ